MPIVENKPEQPEDEAQSPAAEEARPQIEPTEGEAAQPDEGERVPSEEPAGVASPTQLGTRRWVYAAYFAGAIAIAFFVSKIIEMAWHRLQVWKPGLPDADAYDAYIMLFSALVGAGAAVYYWYRTRARQLAEEVASEMSKVTWPTRTEVTNGTFVVIVATIISTVFFALMDKFWGFVTNLVYGGS